MNNVIKVNDVVKDYDKHRALDHVSLEIPEGVIYGLLGPNGAGKTTLIRILNRITAPDSGEILFDGHRFIEKDLEQIGYLPEERGLYRKMKVSEQAVFLAQLKGLSKQEATRRLKLWFEKLDIMDWWNKRIEELSKGMAQKVQFICTVIHEPRLLIFDEPFSGFDPINAEVLKREILELRDKGHTIIFSTHNMQSVEEVCDHIALINRSRVVLEGDVFSIKNSYRGDRYRIVFRQEIQLPSDLAQNYKILNTSTDKHGWTSLQISPLSSHGSSSILQDFSRLGDIALFEELIPDMNAIFIDKVGTDNLSTDTLQSQS